MTSKNVAPSPTTSLGGHAPPLQQVRAKAWTTGAMGNILAALALSDYPIDDKTVKRMQGCFDCESGVISALKAMMPEMESGCSEAVMLAPRLLSCYLAPCGNPMSLDGLARLHRTLFQDISPQAGTLRKNLSETERESLRKILATPIVMEVGTPKARDNLAAHLANLLASVMTVKPFGHGDDLLACLTCWRMAEAHEHFVGFHNIDADMLRLAVDSAVLGAPALLVAVMQEITAWVNPLLIHIQRKVDSMNTTGRYLYYLGAKETIADIVLRLVPMSAIRLIEPFAGSGALTSALAFRFGSIQASDLNAELIEAHTQASSNPQAFIQTLNQFFGAPGSHTPEFYKDIQTKFNTSNDLAAKAAYLVFMNRKGFKGLMRHNSKGEFNVPFWEERAKQPTPAAQIEAFAERLGGKTTFTGQDFREALKNAGWGDFCYLDPPYLAEAGKETTFTDYVGAFTVKDHEEMARLCRQAANKGATVVVSNHDSPLARQTYHSADRIYLIDVPRSMSRAKGKGNSSAREMLAVWQPTGAWVESFVRKPPLGKAPDPYGRSADQATLDRRVFLIAEKEGWLVPGADPDKISFRSFKENGRCLLSIARLGSPILRRLALEHLGRAKTLSLHLLADLITTESHYPPKELLPEEEAAAVLLDLTTRLEKALGDHALAKKGLTRLLTTKATLLVTVRPEPLPTKRLPERYRAALDAVAGRQWTFKSTPCQRLLLYADLCEDEGSNNFIRLCKRVSAGLSQKALLAALPPLKTLPGKGVSADDYMVIPASKMREMRKAIDAEN